MRARPAGGARRSERIEAQGALIRDLLAGTPDVAIEVLRAALTGRGHGFG